MFNRWGVGCQIIGIIMLSAGISMLLSILIGCAWIVIILSFIFMLLGGYLIMC